MGSVPDTYVVKSGLGEEGAPWVSLARHSKKIEFTTHSSGVDHVGFYSYPRGHDAVFNLR